MVSLIESKYRGTDSKSLPKKCYDVANLIPKIALISAILEFYKYSTTTKLVNKIMEKSPKRNLVNFDLLKYLFFN